MEYDIGDKTFFIAAVMAMRHPRLEVFVSAIAALALMTVLSAAAVHTLYVARCCVLPNHHY